MLKIGEFSKLSRVSIRMLRHYDEIDLLKPALVDRFTEYRYYSEAQLLQCGRIAALKDLGFSLAEIREMLPLFHDIQAIDNRLAHRQAQLEDERLEIERKLLLLDTARKRLRKEETMQYDITIKTFPGRYAASLRMTIPRYEDEGILWQKLCEETDNMHLIPADPCLCAAVFWDGDYKESDVDVEVQKTVKGHYPDTEHVHFRTLPPVTVASCIFRGSYEQTVDVYASCAAWIESNGYAYAGPMFNIYHVSPHETSNPDEYVTEVCWPVKKA